MAATEIEWARNREGRGGVWNPSTGCDWIADECDRCYARIFAPRLKGMGQPKYQRDGDPRTSGPGFAYTEHWHALEIPLRWRAGRRIFVNSMSDVFHHEATREFTAAVWDVMARAPQHEFLVLTKRGKRMGRMLRELPTLPNVWTGVSIGSVKAERKLGHLADVPSALRWVSAEPLIGPPSDRLPELLAAAEVRWVVIGGESGAGARPLELEWMRAWIDAARQVDAGVFVKQLGASWAAEHGGPAKAGDPAYWPEDLRVREHPAGLYPTATPREAACTA